MAKQISKTIADHVKRYVGSVVAERLKQEGFVSMDGEDIFWYRIVNDQVVHSVAFITRHKCFPVNLTISFGCHPLFITPVFQKSPYMYALPGYEVLYPRYELIKMANQYSYAPDILVTCPADEYKGRDIVERVFPVMEDIDTPQACFDLHHSWRKGEIENGIWFNFSTEFVDEVILWEKKSLYPICTSFIKGMTAILERIQKTKKLSTADRKKLEKLYLLKTALIDGEREAHLRHLIKQQQNTIQLLEKHTPIRF